MKQSALIKAVTDSVAKALSTLKSGMKGELAELEARVKALEDGSAFADLYKGVHLQGQHHRRGEMVTQGGSLWICLAATRDRPGESAAWRLIVKGMA